MQGLLWGSGLSASGPQRVASARRRSLGYPEGSQCGCEATGGSAVLAAIVAIRDLEQDAER